MRYFWLTIAIWVIIVLVIRFIKDKEDRDFEEEFLLSCTIIGLIYLIYLITLLTIKFW